MTTNEIIEKCAECSEVSEKELARVKVAMKNVVQYLTAKSSIDPHAKWVLSQLEGGND